MFKKFIDELTILDEYSRKTVGDLKNLTDENFNSLFKRSDIFHKWLDGIRILRSRVNGGDVQ